MDRDKDDELIRGHARVGDAEITVCTDGTCRFDGGAMFGVVPKTLWSKKTEPDELNRVMLGLNCAVVRLGGKTVLIETGFGDKIAPKLKDIYATQAVCLRLWLPQGSGRRTLTSSSTRTCTGTTVVGTRCSTKVARPNPSFRMRNILPIWAR